MLIQGGTISSGRWWTCSVLGAYWISCISSFWNTTLPGEVATFLPTAKASSSLMLICRRPLPRSRSSSRCCRPSSRFWPPVSLALRSTAGLVSTKFDGATALDELAREEVDLVLLAPLEPRHVLDQPAQPARREQIGLLDVVEDQILAPGLVLEPPIAALGRDHRRGLLRPSCAAPCSARAPCCPARAGPGPRRAASGRSSAACRAP